MNRMKITSIRNLAIRYHAKSLAHSIFSRSETGNLISDELYLLWNILKGRQLNLAHFIMKYLERQSRKRKGGLGCGGVITLLDLNEFSYEISGLQPMPAELRIDREFLVGAKFWRMDQSGQGYILQRHKDDFPVPDPHHTYVNGYYYRDNWLMNTPEHRFIVESRPHGPWTTKWEYPNIPTEMPIPVLPPHYLDPQPQFDVPMLTMGVEQPYQFEQAIPEINMAESNGQGESRRRTNQGEGRSQGEGRGRRANYEGLAYRMETLDIVMAHMRDRQESFMSQFTSQNDANWTRLWSECDGINKRLDEQQTRLDAQQTTQDEIQRLLQSFHASSPHPHPPPPQ